MRKFIRNLLNPPSSTPTVEQEALRQAILELSELQAQIDSLRITLMKSRDDKYQAWGDS